VKGGNIVRHDPEDWTFPIKRGNVHDGKRGGGRSAAGILRNGVEREPIGAFPTLRKDRKGARLA